MDINILSFIIGTGLGLIGLVIAYFQWRDSREARRLRETQLLASINRAYYLIIPNEVILLLLKEASPQSNPALHQWIWSLHKGASDNYVQTVSHYLSTVKKFTFDDLERLKQAGAISTNWEEKIWRSLITTRDENRTGEITDFEVKRKLEVTEEKIDASLGKEYIDHRLAESERVTQEQTH